MRSHWTWLPSPTGSPLATTSTTPPSVSPSFLHASISAIIARSAAGSATRTAESSVIRASSLDRDVGGHFRLDRSDTHDVTEHGNSERLQQLPRERADRDARGGLARRGAFQHVADIVEVVLEHAGQIRVSRPRARDGLRLAAIARVDRHLLHPVLEVLVLDYESDRAAERAAEADPGNDPRLVALDRHPAAPPVAFLPAREVVIEARQVDFEPGRNALDHRDQFRSVRFARM